MKLSHSTKINELLEKFPFLLEFLADYNPKFRLLKNRTMRATMGRMANLGMVASMGNISLDTLLKDIAGEIKKNTGEDIEIVVSGTDESGRKKLETLKEIIRDLHKGMEFSVVKDRFDKLMSEIEPSQIAEMEEQLIREGMPAEEIQRLCDLHVSVFKSALEQKEPVETLSGHPVHTFMEENTVFAGLIKAFDSLVTKLADNPSQEKYMELKKDMEFLQKIMKLVLYIMDGKALLLLK